MIRNALVFCLWASTGQAASLCDVPAEEALAALAGEWSGPGAVSIETETLSVVEDAPFQLTLTADGLASEGSFSAWVSDPVMLEPGVVYDVDGVDDILATLEAEWIADDVSLTPCGPEALPQVSAEIEVAPDFNGRVTLVPYFTDQVIMIFEYEFRGDWGLAFVTEGALMTLGG